MEPATVLARPPIATDWKVVGRPPQTVFLIQCIEEKYSPTPGTVRRREGIKPRQRPVTPPEELELITALASPNMVPDEVEEEDVCILVLIKSKGWKRMVEAVPEREPARKAFNTGLADMRMSWLEVFMIRN